MNRIAVLLATLLMAAPLLAKEPTMPGKSALAAPTFTTINGNPLQINVGSDGSYQVFNAAVPGQGQIYPSSANQTADMGWFVRVGNTLYAPNFGAHPGGTATGGLGSSTAFAETSLGPVIGDGTVATPYSVRVVNGLGITGLTATKRTFFVTGNNYFTEQFRLLNSTFSPITATVFLGSDIYLASSDSGVPLREPASGSPGGRTCDGVAPVYNILHIPLTPANNYTAVTYSSVWTQIGGGTLNNTVGTGCIDNGAALQWNITVPANGSVSLLAATSFGDVPAITQFAITDVSPALGSVGNTVPVTIAGRGFQAGTTFTFGAGISVGSVNIISPTSASAVLQIAPDAALGFRDVVATRSPGGTVATLFDGFAVAEPPVWNYSVNPLGNVSPTALTCIRNKFPANPPTNAAGWAPSEGEFYHEDPSFPGFYFPPNGLARAILDCFVTAWDANAGSLYYTYCWQDPTPWYIGAYPEQRQAQFQIFFSVNGVCTTPPVGTPVFEQTVLIMRQLYYPPPMLRTGFE